MDHIVIDLETWGTRPGYVVTSVGCYTFDPKNFAQEMPDPSQSFVQERMFFMNADPQSCVDHGLKIDVSTLKWWMKRERSAIDATLAGGQPLPIVLTSLTAFIGKVCDHRFDDVRIWGHGATFDPVLLAEAYHACGMKVPWNYHNVRDTRTLFEEWNVVLPKNNHHALQDAFNEAMMVKICAVKKARLEGTFTLPNTAAA